MSNLEVLRQYVRWAPGSVNRNISRLQGGDFKVVKRGACVGATLGLIAAFCYVAMSYESSVIYIGIVTLAFILYGMVVGGMVAPVWPFLVLLFGGSVALAGALISIVYMLGLSMQLITSIWQALWVGEPRWTLEELEVVAKNYRRTL